MGPYLLEWNKEIGQWCIYNSWEHSLCAMSLSLSLPKPLKMEAFCVQGIDLREIEVWVVHITGRVPVIWMFFYFPHRSWKLQVLDLRDAYYNFRNVCAGLEQEDCSPVVIGKNQSVGNHHIQERKQIMTILMNISLMTHLPYKYLQYFITGPLRERMW